MKTRNERVCEIAIAVKDLEVCALALATDRENAWKLKNLAAAGERLTMIVENMSRRKA